MNADFRAALLAAIECRNGQRKGDEITFTCANPNHEDAHPSARFNVKKNVWTCPACGAGGGALDLAKLLGVELPETRSKASKKKKRPVRFLIQQNSDAGRRSQVNVST